ncbi:MAG: phosphate/phosphite/phosphonate ABC transporter substrate-binding protein [Anaerolineae bacterium]|nr:phosphate/phosphite/phosphonate ABC transporter substrate-binding protein [Anaerolineae bacterium]
MRRLIGSLLLLVLLLTLISSVAVAAPPAQEGQTYTIQADDWLSKLADKYLGDVFAWPAIWGATNAKAETDSSYTRILDPNLIEVGQVLYIPSEDEAAAFLAGPKPAAGELGSEENPIIWSFVPSGEMERVSAGADAVADLIYQETGLFIETNVATEYAGVIEAMCSDPPKAHMASLATFAYVLAAQKGCAESELVSVRYGLPTYNGQIIAGADTGLTDVSQLAGKTFCRPDPLSTSGWIIPMLTMRAAGINTDTDLAQVVDAGSHDAVVAAVYNGDCDAGATYVDARTRVEGDFPDVMDKVNVIGLTTDIPNDGVQYVPSMPRELRDAINAALLKIAQTEEGQAALNTAYQWSGLEPHYDTFYDPFRQVLDAAGMDVEALQ